MGKILRSFIFLLIMTGSVSTGYAYASIQPLKAMLMEASGTAQELQSWTLGDLEKVAKNSSNEKDPESGKLLRYKGVSLIQLVDQALAKITPERRAQIDLVILKGASDQALIPRSFIVKYSMLVAFQADGKELGADKGPYTVVPWTSKPQLLNEYLPVESYFIPQLKEIQFANYKDRYGQFYLKRRTDPAAMRGEKLFVQNCLACHAAGRGPSLEKTRTVANEVHTGQRPTKGMPKFSEKERRYLGNYFDAFFGENPSGPGAATASGFKIPGGLGPSSK